MNSSCFLKTLGHPELKRPDGSVFRVKVRKHLALLVFLAVDDREFHSREELVELLWNDVPEARGRHSLSVALSVLRTLLGPDAIEASASQIHLRKKHLAMDLDLLESGDVLALGDARQLEIDQFLGGFDIDSPAFLHWRDRQQAQLLPAIQSGLLILADHARRSGDLTAVLLYADRLLAIDALSEEGIKAKVQALAMQGDRVSALRVYEGWKTELSGQLGAVPSDHLEGLAARLRRRGVERPDTRTIPAVQTDHWADREFFGRTSEFREMSDAWDSVTESSASHVLITGETGIGKSTLAMRFGTSVALEGAAVARVQCFELEQRIAFGMIGALVTSLLDRPGVVATAPESLAEVARIVPKVKERFPNLPKPRAISEEAARLHFSEGTFALFDAIMDEQPLVLIVDDYPRSDEASLGVLHMLMRRVTANRLMVIATSRPPEPDEPPQATRIRKGLAYLPMRHIVLSALPESECSAMLGSVLRSAGKEPDPSIRRAILVASSGNPMALSLLAQDWAAHGDVSIAISLPAMRTDMPASAIDAMGYDRLVERLLPDLSPRTRTALYLAAILGPRLNDLEYFELLELTSAQTMAAISELMDRRVLRDTGGGLEFVNELVRARLYLRIPSAVRIRLHSDVATRLLACVALGESIPSLEIAWHCIRARRRDEATPFLLAGARDAIRHGAPDEAARALSTALGHLTGAVKDEALLLLAEAYQEMSEWKAALESLAGINGSRKDSSYVAEMASVLAIESRLRLGHYSPQDLSAVCDDCRDKAIKYHHNAARVQASLIAAMTAARLRQPSVAESVDVVLSSISIVGSDPVNQGKLLLAKGITTYNRRIGAMGRDEALAGARLLNEAGVTDTTFVRINHGLGVIACSQGLYAEGEQHLKTAFRAAERLDHEPLMSSIAVNLSLCYHRLGVPEEQLKWSTLSLERSTPSNEGGYDHLFPLAQRSLALIALGRYGEVDKMIGELRRVRRIAESPWVLQASFIFEADVQWLLGRRKRAYDSIENMRETSAAPLSKEFVGDFVRWNTLYLTNTGRIDEACSLVDLGLGQIEELDLFDQAEILCSNDFLLRRGRRAPSATELRPQTVLSRLPMACTLQLADLGLLLAD